jgi:hypothetical protein
VAQSEVTIQPKTSEKKAQGCGAPGPLDTQAERLSDLPAYPQRTGSRHFGLQPEAGSAAEPAGGAGNSPPDTRRFPTVSGELPTGTRRSATIGRLIKSSLEFWVTETCPARQVRNGHGEVRLTAV